MGEYGSVVVYHVEFFFGNMLRKEVFGIGKQKLHGKPFLDFLLGRERQKDHGSWATYNDLSRRLVTLNGGEK